VGPQEERSARKITARAIGAVPRGDVGAWVVPGTNERCSLTGSAAREGEPFRVATKVRLSHGVELRLALQFDDAVRSFQAALRNDELLEIRDGVRVVAVNPQQVVYFEAEPGLDESATAGPPAPSD
jgi:hypothetical protein